MKKWLILVFVVLATSFPGLSQTDAFSRKHDDLKSKNPSDINFELRLKNNKTHFQPGELIQLELLFSTSSTKKYVFNARSYDRSGRLHLDDFEFDLSEAAVDPLSDFFSRSGGGFLGGGLFTAPILGAKAEIVSYDLNEYKRFLRPGRYRLFVNSPRLSLGTRAFEFGSAVDVTSNIIEFEIVKADPKWQAATLADAVKILDAAKPETDRKSACVRLRYLDTEGAAREMVRRFTNEQDECFFSFMMGLHSSPHRRVIVEEMSKALQNPDFPVTSPFFYTLARIAYFHENPAPPRLSDRSEENIENERVLQDRLRRGVQERIRRMLETAIAGKKGKALAVSLDTLIGSSDDERASPVQIAALARVFSDLPAARKHLLLEYQWKTIGDAAFLPNLRAICRGFRTLENPEYDERRLYEISIRRIYELAPDEGRNLILEEMRRAQPRVGIETLSLLTETELPEFENEWLAKAEKSEIFLDLLERYGTVSIIPRIRESFENKIGAMPCRPQASVIRIFFKFDTTLALKSLQNALDSRASTACYNTVLAEIPKERWSKDVENIAIGLLSDDDLGLVKSTVEVLARNGSAGAKSAIIESFERFSRRMKNDPEANQTTFGSYKLPMSTIEGTFISALTESENWTLTDDEKARVSSICVTKPCSDRLAPRSNP